MTSPSGKRQKILIAGPCSVETPEQIRHSMQEAQKRPLDFFRMSLWKPRTKPGFDGLQETGIPLLAEAVMMGLQPATEVLIPQQAEAILEAVLPHLENRKLMLWIGSRNQNHMLQQQIAQVASQDPRVMLMLKNQPWTSEAHWEGIIEHVLAGGMNPANVVLCHRGFTPGAQNPQGLRNVPDHGMAMRIKEKSGLVMIFDPSHTAGHVSKVSQVAEESAKHAYDGMVVEVHPNPAEAWTDAQQQLTWNAFDQLCEKVSLRQNMRLVS